MTMDKTIRALLAGAALPAECKAARAAWAKRTAKAWREAHRDMDEFLDQAAEALSEPEFERLCDAEFARVDAIMAELRAAIDEDKWPKEFYRGGI